MNGINILNLMLKHTPTRSVKVSGIVNCDFKTVNGDAQPAMHVCVESKVFHLEMYGFWIKVDLRDAEFTSQEYSDTMSEIRVVTPGFDIQLIF